MSTEAIEYLFYVKWSRKHIYILVQLCTIFYNFSTILYHFVPFCFQFFHFSQLSPSRTRDVAVPVQWQSDKGKNFNLKLYFFFKFKKGKNCPLNFYITIRHPYSAKKQRITKENFTFYIFMVNLVQNRKISEENNRE